MALRLPIKITRSFIPNLGKVFYSGKSITKPVCNLNEDDTAKPATQDGNTNASHAKQIPISLNTKLTEADIIHRDMKHHLQPSKLGKFYIPPADITSGVYPKQENPQLDYVKGASQYRHFEKSTTYKNIKLPLKKPKLVSPFPDPVKEMPSDTLSDLEKADLKEAQARCAKSDAKILLNSSQCRNYSKDAKSGDKCKKIGKKKKQCPGLKSPCKGNAAKKKTCENEYEFKKCKKKEAPYAAYSEACHTIPDSTPSECRSCPWKSNENPNFKPRKKKFHTSCATYSSRKKQREKQQLRMNSKRGWVIQEKWSLMESTHEMHIDPLLCRKKPPCEMPKSQSKQNKKKSKKKSKKKKKKKKGKKGKSQCPKKPNCGGKSKPKKKCTTIDSNKSWVTLADPQSLQELPTLFNHRTVPHIFKSKPKSKRIGAGHIRKFPLRGGCINSKQKNKDGTLNYCKTVIMNNQEFNGTSTKPTQSESISIEYLLDKSKKPECPKISRGKCQLEPDDPCRTLRKGITRECSTDLLEKKRRKPKKPKKKTPGETPSVGVPPSLLA